MKRPFLTALRRGSISASYGETEYSCTRQLGIDRDFTEVSLSNGIVLYMPISILGTLVFFVWIASLYQVQVTWVWYAIAAICCDPDGSSAAGPWRQPSCFYGDL